LTSRQTDSLDDGQEAEVWNDWKRQDHTLFDATLLEQQVLPAILAAMSAYQLPHIQDMYSTSEEQSKIVCQSMDLLHLMGFINEE
jgi:hypothetical protein